MQPTDRKPLSLLSLGLAALLIAGCASMGLEGLARFGPPKRPAEPVVETPAKRIDALRQLAEDAPDADAAEQERLSTLLAASMRSELDPLVRAQTVRTISYYPTDTALSVQASALQDGDGGVRIAACEAWGRKGGSEAAQRLSGILAGDTDFDVRMAAARALGEIKDPASVAGLAAALDDPDPAMQRRGVESLERLTGKYYGNDVNAWRQFVQGQPPQAPSMPIAERFRRLF